MARRNRRKASSKKNSLHEHPNDSGKELPENDLSSAPVEKRPILIDKKELRDAALERAKKPPHPRAHYGFFP